MESVQIKIDGMHCDGCAERISRLLTKEPGVRNAQVSYSEGSATVTYNAHNVSADRLHTIIEQAGFSVMSA